MKLRERRDDPILERRDVAAKVGAALVQVEHQVDHALAGAVISELAAAAGAEDGEPVGRDEVLVLGAGAGGIERRMLHQPDKLRRLARGNCGSARFHGGDSLGVGEEPFRDDPLNGRAG